MDGSSEIGVLSALWFGILTSISPCPLAANIAAISYVGRNVGSPAKTILAGALYSAGRIIAYVALGAAAVWSLMSIVDASRFLQGTFSRLLGPMLIIVGLILVGVIRFNFSGRGVSDQMQQRVDRAGLWGALPLGAVLALAFCPVSAALFFGSLVPLAIEHRSPVVLPMFYGLGTGLPVVVFAVLLGLGVRQAGVAVKRLATFEQRARLVTAVVFICVGLYETLRSTFHVI